MTLHCIYTTCLYTVLIHMHISKLYYITILIPKKLIKKFNFLTITGAIVELAINLIQC